MEIELTPKRLNFGEILPDGGKTKTTKSVELKNLSQKPLKINTISSPDDFITLHLKEELPFTLAENKKLQFEVEIDPNLLKDKTFGRVIIDNDNAHTPKVTFYVSGRIKSPQPQKLPQRTISNKNIPEIEFTKEAIKLFSKYNFVFNNITQNLAGCKLGRCLPMKTFIQTLIDKKTPENKISQAVRSIYGPKAIAHKVQNPSIKPSIKVKEQVQNPSGKKLKEQVKNPEQVQNSSGKKKD